MYNILQTELMLKNIQQVFQVIQKVSYSYDYESKKIIDPLGLSVTLKSLALDLNDSEEHLQRIVEIPDVKEKIDLIQSLKKDLSE